MKPRTYQKRAVTAALRLAPKRVLIVSPGGSGKTVMIAMLAKSYLKQGKRVLVFSHRRELVEQAEEHFGLFNIPADKIGIVLAGRKPNPKAPLQCGSIQTLRNYPPEKVDVVIVDEGHHAVAPSYRDFIEQYPRAHVYGLTATPQRLDGNPLNEGFDVMVEAAKPSELIEAGYIAKPKIFAPPEEVRPNLDRVRVFGGDYVIGELDLRMNRDYLVGGIVDHYKQRGHNRRGVAFAVSILHADNIAYRFVKAGIRAKTLNANTPLPEREDILDDFRRGHVKVLVNCMILTEGVDVPACDVVMLARPTLSQTLFLQQCARGMRPHGRAHPTILDHAGNTWVHGLPHADRIFSLDQVVRAHPSGSAGVRICMKCGLYVTTRICPDCGFVFPEPDPVEDMEETHETLEEVKAREVEALKARIEKYFAGRNRPVDPEFVQRALSAWNDGSA